MQVEIHAGRQAFPVAGYPADRRTAGVGPAQGVGHRSARDDLAQVARDEGVACADRVDDLDRQGGRPVHLVAGQRQRAEGTELDHHRGRAPLGQLPRQQLALVERRRSGRAAEHQRGLLRSGEDEVGGRGEAGQHRCGGLVAPQGRAVVDVEGHEGAGGSSHLHRPLDRGQRGRRRGRR